MIARALGRLAPSLALLGASLVSFPAAATGIGPLSLAVASAAADDDTLAEYYRSAGYASLWVGPGPAQRARREALILALDRAEVHGLPPRRYGAAGLRERLATARTARQMGVLDVELSRLFLLFAGDLRIGLLDPGEVAPAIKRARRGLDPLRTLNDFARARPHAFLDALAPRTREYARLLGEKRRLEEAIVLDAWGAPVRAPRLEEGARGPDVAALRDRLTAMGYLGRSASGRFDARLRRAVEAFQADHGLSVDGIVGGDTLSELNIGPGRRLGQILVAMERERWLNVPRGDTHVWVNLPDFHARIIRNGESVFETRSVIGRPDPDRQTPEFSDTMEHMVINPSWYVPRSIAVGEYLPALRANPYAHRELQIVDGRGGVVNRGRGFGQYTPRSFPYSMRQPPGPDNALGQVKFMFPNRYNIYLHDTPAKHLFERTVRAYSHGCIRLDEPREFAHALLEMQTDDPEGAFRRRLETGRTARVDLEAPVPVHLVYRTAIAKPGGGMEYRGDIYGRDAPILGALLAQGVRVPGLDRRLALSGIDG